MPAIGFFFKTYCNRVFFPKTTIFFRFFGDLLFAFLRKSGIIYNARCFPLRKYASIPKHTNITYTKQNKPKGKLKMKHCKQAFTLIELLVVICIIAILASMLLPALQSARESASSATCISNLGQFSKAFQMYATNYNDYMPALTDPQGGSCSWEYALIDALGQDRNNSPFRKSFFCDADGSSETISANKKSYSLNNLQEAIHPYLPNTLGPNGVLSTKGANLGYISGNKTTAVFTASDLIVIGENVSSSNNFGTASFSKTDVNSPGSASPIQQQVSIYKRLTSHNTAGELYLDGHARHVKPQQTLPTKDGLLVAKKTAMADTNPSGIATKGIGSWTDCFKRKESSAAACSGDCHKK